MIEEPPLLRIRRSPPRPTPEQIAAFQGVPSSFVVDAMFGGGAFDPTIRPLGTHTAKAVQVAGPALTVQNSAADILALLGALGSIQDGDIVISSFGGFQKCAAAGDRVSQMMRACGAAGFVTDGPMRDIEGIEEVGLPSWATGLTPGSPYTNGPGTVGFAIQIGGQQVESGDMIVADQTGVAVVPFAKIDATIAMLSKVSELENSLDAELKEGMKIPPSIQELLASDKVLYED